MPKQFLFKELFLKEVAKTKGMVNCHAHLDRAYTLTEENFALSNTLMEEKWVLNRDIKKAHTRESLIKRFDDAIALFMEQGIIACRTFVDADNIVDMLCINTAAEMREKYKGKFILQLAPQPLEGFLNEEATDFDKRKVDLFEKACAICDVVGGLPSRDRKFGDGGRKHADFLFSMAKNLNKDIDVHIDQENNPLEKDTEWFLDKVVENHMEGRVTLIHALSVSCQSTEDRQRIYKKMVDTGTNVTVCPKAVITMKQHKDKMAPVHNSIAQVDEMLEAGVNVSIGTDNISDIIVPDCSGDLTDEVLMLAAACRLYDMPKLAAVATINGYKTLKLNL